MSDWTTRLRFCLQWDDRDIFEICTLCLWDCNRVSTFFVVVWFMKAFEHNRILFWLERTLKWCKTSAFDFFAFALFAFCYIDEVSEITLADIIKRLQRLSQCLKTLSEQFVTAWHLTGGSKSILFWRYVHTCSDRVFNQFIYFGVANFMKFWFDWWISETVLH